MKEQMSGFCGILLEALGTNLLENMLAAEGVTRQSKGAKQQEKGDELSQQAKEQIKEGDNIFNATSLVA